MWYCQGHGVEFDSCAVRTGDVPHIVQDQTFSVVEAGSDVPFLPLDQIALNLHTQIHNFVTM